MTGSESEGSLTCLEAVTAHSFEENDVPVSSGKHRMSEGKDCGGGDALSNGIKKHRYSGRWTAAWAAAVAGTRLEGAKTSAVLYFLPGVGCLCCLLCLSKTGPRWNPLSLSA